MTKFKCEFCGSKELKIKTPFIDRVTGKPTETFCCRASKVNAEYDKKKWHPIFNKK